MLWWNVKTRCGIDGTKRQRRVVIEFKRTFFIAKPRHQFSKLPEGNVPLLLEGDWTTHLAFVIGG